MLPSPSASPQSVLENRTNLFHTPTQRKLSFALPTLPNDKHAKRRATGEDGRQKKRHKLSLNEISGESSDSEEGDVDSDADLQDGALVQPRARKHTPFHLRTRAAMANPVHHRYENSTCLMIYIRDHNFILQIATRPILQSFVSSNKSDLFKCQSTDMNAYLTPPYACSYTYSGFESPYCLPLLILSIDAKKGGIPLLAVATEQGSVHIINTARRKDWDCGELQKNFKPINTVTYQQI